MGSEHVRYHTHIPIRLHNDNYISKPQPTSHDTSFPIILVAIIGILTTAFLLVSYYVFVIKCCFNWHPTDVFRPMSRRRRHDHPLNIIYASTSPPMSTGLDESVIRAIPVVKFRRVVDECVDGKSSLSFRECAVCLNEFHEEEKVRVLPGCSHLFHIDCIDIWLQSNPNCPLCRTSISSNTSPAFPPHPIPTPTPTTTTDPPQQRPDFVNVDNSFITIEVKNNGDHDPERHNAVNPSPRKQDQRTIRSNLLKARELKWVSSMGDECIDVRTKDDRFSVQPIRRSISMDSSADRQLLLSVQEALRRQSRHCGDYSSGTSEGCTGSCSNRTRRSLFSFGSGRGLSKSAVLPVWSFEEVKV